MRYKNKSSAPAALIPAEHLVQVAAVLRVLAHPQRLRLVELLNHQPRPVKDLAVTLQMGQAAVSQHLGLMRAQGIVEPRRCGRQVIYHVINPNAVTLLGCIRRHGAGCPAVTAPATE
ncbi:MAG: HTH-type transcriptional regulator NmtR [Phycisphaerae bacterium]|nr:HTH-type transcriptional regulator NmtR [Phycisphaerae bacterium]